MKNPSIRLMIPGLILLVLIVIGMIGYTIFEGWPLLDSLYMVVITLSTVGFREVHTLDTTGKLLTMFIIIAGVGTAVYTLGQLVELVVSGEIIGYRRKRKMEKMISEMRDHYIICGFGRVGHQVSHELLAEGKKVVIIDSKPETAQELEGQNIPYIIGDITADEKLDEAGIRSAKGLVACADSDTSNVFVTLSARNQNPHLFIVARASQKESEEKMKKAGADRVISPYFIAGRRMATMAVKPIAVEYLDTILHSEHLELTIKECRVTDESKIVNKTLSEAQIRQNSGAYVLSIRKPTGNFELQPKAESVVEPGDVLVAIGTAPQLTLLDNMLKP